MCGDVRAFLGGWGGGGGGQGGLVEGADRVRTEAGGWCSGMCGLHTGSGMQPDTNRICCLLPSYRGYYGPCKPRERGGGQKHMLPKAWWGGRFTLPQPGAVLSLAACDARGHYLATLTLPAPLWTLPPIWIQIS